MTLPLTPNESPRQELAKGRTVLWVLIAAVTGLLIGVTGTLGITSIANVAAPPAPETRLVDAVDKCGAGVGTELGDEDRTLVIDVQGEEDTVGASYADQACILADLGMPASVESHINQTTSLDGRQTESWDGITIEWSYHPDRGSDMVIQIDEIEKG